MEDVSRDCLLLWRDDIYHQRYQKVVDEVGDIAILFHNENNKEWIKVLEELAQEIRGLTKYTIGHNEKYYMNDFLMHSIKAMKGKMTIQELRKKTEKTLRLLERPYSS